MYLNLSEVNLYYEITGSGPFLFIIQSGEGDARRTSQLVSYLREQFTVVTYDRRGLSRSKLKNDSTVSINNHSNDLYQLISSLTNTSVDILGCSIGATIALNTSYKYENVIKKIVAHEPILPSILPEKERQLNISELEEIREIYLHGKWMDGIKKMAAVLGINPHAQTKEADALIEPMTIERKPNFDFFIKNDFQSIIDFNFSSNEILAIEKHTDIFPAVGIETHQSVFDYKCSQIIANELNKELICFPGGHNGNTTHPKGYAEMLQKLLT